MDTVPQSQSPDPPLMSASEYIVYIVDDDVNVCDALCELLLSMEIRAVAFNSVADYLAYPKVDLPGCLVLDVELPDSNGLDFQKQIVAEHHPPIVFITGHGDIPSSVSAIKRGAVDFLTKPFSVTDLVAAINAAVALHIDLRQSRAEMATLRERLSRLTPRERDVLPLVVAGLLNKQAAAELGISEVTLQIHRSNIMHKMEAASLADLVRIAERLQIPITRSRRVGNA